MLKETSNICQSNFINDNSKLVTHCLYINKSNEIKKIVRFIKSKLIKVTNNPLIVTNLLNKVKKVVATKYKSNA